MRRARTRWASIAAIVGALAACAPIVRKPGESEAIITAAAMGETRELERLVNRRRRHVKCAPLVWDDRLAAVAQRHSEDMARRRFFDHTNPDGDDPFERLEAAGIGFRAAAENIAEGQRTGNEVFDGWIRSSGHRQNIENCTYTRHGIGLYQGYWTHVFVRPPDRR